MITPLLHPPEYAVVPQAIFWRPLEYFCAEIRVGEDDLDTYRAASFIIGNNIRYDLRTYTGHPAVTVTMYLPADIVNENEISSSIERVAQEMQVPRSAIAWQRGLAFEFGILKRPPEDRLLENEAKTLALKIAALRPNRQASTTFIRENVPTLMELSAEDLKPPPRWHQIIRNVTRSNHDSSDSIYSKGYAQMTDDGILVTDFGIEMLESIGFLSRPS